MEDLIMQMTAWVCTGGSIGVGLLLVLALFKQFLFIGKPNEVLVFSGRSRKLADGSSVGYREVLGGGWTWRWPIIEKVDRMRLTTIPIEINTTNAYSAGGIPLNVHAVANIKVSSNPSRVKNAIERFMGRDPLEIQRVGKETLEGHLRGVLARLTPEEVNEDRLKFAQELTAEAEEDFVKLGLDLDVLKIQNVSDDVNYLDSIGRTRIAQVIRDAEIAESNAKSEALQAEAASTESGDVATQDSERSIVQKANELRELRGSLEANVQAELKKAERAAAAARANAEVELQDLRRQVEELRLQADVVLPAEARRQAAVFEAKGKASYTEEEGRAQAAVLQMMTDAWLSAGEDAKDIFLIQQLEQVLRTVVERVNGVAIDEVNLLDGGDGTALPRHVASFPAMVRQVLTELEGSTGINVPEILGSAINDKENR
ncbi:MAG: SPFH domain-containing protein [Myxococcota bacterium]|nr:SPFH domain-containing protein [Myxococcota bacterium]MEC9390198.1 SPFH domain-containing protein [Myxococcota bacterium]